VPRRHSTVSQRLLQDADNIANAWYTGNKWPRVQVSYTTLFLPAMHIAIALCFTGEHIFGQLSLSALRSSARTGVEAMQAPVEAWLSQGTMQRIVTFVSVQLPEVLQEYAFYIILVPVFAIMLVRRLQLPWRMCFVGLQRRALVHLSRTGTKMSTGWASCPQPGAT
jgi:hypothetical protein